MYRLLLVSAALVCGIAQASTPEVARPEVFSFGSTVASMQARLAPLCASLRLKVVLPITAPLAKDSQHQLDCEGFVYAGKPRKLELVFQDDRLDLVWILIPEAERASMVQAFTARYGAPSFEIPFGAIYLQVNAAVRQQPSEVMFASPRQAQAMLAQLRASPAVPHPAQDTAP